MASAWDMTPAPGDSSQPVPSAWDATPAVVPSSAPAAALNPFDLHNDEYQKIQNYSPRDAIGGLVRGAGSIGATFLRPFESEQANDQRRSSMDDALANLVGADPSSTGYKTNKLLSEVAGTYGTGSAIGSGLRMIPGAVRALPTLIPAIESAGMSANGATGAYGLAVRAAGGGVAGATAAGMVDPRAAPAGAVIGALTPPVVKLAGDAGSYLSNKAHDLASYLMQSAIKPTIAQLRSGDAQIAAQTLLKNGLSPTAKGVDKLKAVIDDTDKQISSAISGSTALVDKNKVIQALNDTRQTFGSQVTPTADLQAINNAQTEFLNHPNYPGPTIPVQDAQTLKQGTYQVLQKKYGQLGSADTEAQKALARGLKDQIASAVPGVSEYNAKLSDLLRTLDVTQRRALMESNKNPLGLAALATSPQGFAAFLADRSALVKALAARGVYAAAPAGKALGMLDNPALLPAQRAALLGYETSP